MSILKSVVEGLGEVPEAPTEYVFTIPVKDICDRLGIPVPPAEEMQGVIEALLKAATPYMQGVEVTVAVTPEYIFVKVTLPKSELFNLLEAVPQVQKVEYNCEVSLPPTDLQQNDIPGASSQAGIMTNLNNMFLGFNKVQADSRFDMGRNLIVGVIDTGVGDPSRPQYGYRAPQLFVDPEDPNSAYRVTRFKDIVGGKTVAYDDHGHGTAVASILAGAKKTNQTLNETYIGALPQATVYVAKVLKYDGTGTLMQVIQGMSWMMNQIPKPDIVNMSLGVPGATDGKDSVSVAADQMWKAGIILVVAAGNGGQNNVGNCNKTIGPPACAFEDIKAGATSGARSTPEAVQAWSSRGPTLDGRKGPELHYMVAPGLSIRVYDGRLSGRSGTSFASPYTAGHAGVAVAAQKYLGKPVVNNEIRALMEKYTIPLGYKDKYGVDGWCIEGFGRISPYDLWNALISGVTPPECNEGDIVIIDKCPDGVTWKTRKICISGHWQTQTQDCPVQPPPVGIPEIVLTIKLNGNTISQSTSDKPIVVEVDAVPITTPAA